MILVDSIISQYSIHSIYMMQNYGSNSIIYYIYIRIAIDKLKSFNLRI